MKKGYVVSIVLNCILICILLIITILFFNGTLSDYFDNFSSKFSASSSLQYPEVEFTKTYYIVSDLNKSDSSYNYYVINQFNVDDPTVVKISKNFSLGENKNYEFKFKGINQFKDYSIHDIFNEFEIISIIPTDKEGENQIQDNL